MLKQTHQELFDRALADLEKFALSKCQGDIELIMKSIFEEVVYSSVKLRKSHIESICRILSRLSGHNEVLFSRFMFRVRVDMLEKIPSDLADGLVATLVEVLEQTRNVTAIIDILETLYIVLGSSQTVYVVEKLAKSSNKYVRALLPIFMRKDIDSGNAISLDVARYQRLFAILESDADSEVRAEARCYGHI